MSFFDDVGAFHRRFGLPLFDPNGEPRLLTEPVFEFRKNFLEEEMAELVLAQARGDLPELADALVDLVYVALGTAHLAGLDFNAHWEAVQTANMEKERPSGPDDPRLKRRSSGLALGLVVDIVKPLGWQPPDHHAIIARRLK